MRDEKKRYIAPEVEITEFECEDDILTVSGRALRRNITGSDNDPDYTSAGSKKWSDIYE